MSIKKNQNTHKNKLEIHELQKTIPALFQQALSYESFYIEKRSYLYLKFYLPSRVSLITLSISEIISSAKPTSFFTNSPFFPIMYVAGIL